MNFSELRLSQPILRALAQEGYTIPTPIQAQTIPHALDGRDLLGCAQTGTGKTAAFALPILHRLSMAATDKAHRGARKARALILSPTRELAAQIGASFAAYGRETALEHTVIYGGVSQHHQERALRRGVDIIVATPGRLIDLMDQRVADLSGIEVLVLDEADRMLDMGFINPIRRIAGATPSKARQTLMFSATMPASILHLANSLLRDPVRVAVDAGSSSVAPLKIEQAVFMIGRSGKQALLEHLLGEQDRGITRALVFTRTKHGAERVGRKLEREGISAETIHGNKSQPQRRRALARFSTGSARVLVATDVAARGLDVDDITHVFNFDLPVEPEAYVHRIGRTGRAGAAGIALSFCDGEERATLRDIERLIGRKIDVRATPAIAIRPGTTYSPAAGETRPEPKSGSGHTHARTPAHAPTGAHRSAHAPARRAPHPSSSGGGAHQQASGARRGPSTERSARGWRKPSRRLSRR